MVSHGVLFQIANDIIIVLKLVKHNMSVLCANKPSQGYVQTENKGETKGIVKPYDVTIQLHELIIAMQPVY